MMNAVAGPARRHREGNKGVKVVVLAGAGPGFCAGHDLPARCGANPGKAILRKRDVRTHNASPAADDGAIVQPAAAGDRPVHGVATAAGLPARRHLRSRGRGGDARFAISGVNLGLFCSTPMVALAATCRRKQAMEMLLTGELIDADTPRASASSTASWRATSSTPPSRPWRRRSSARAPLTLAIGKEAFYRQAEIGAGRRLPLRLGGDDAPATCWRATRPRASTHSSKSANRNGKTAEIVNSGTFHSPPGATIFGNTRVPAFSFLLWRSRWITIPIPTATSAAFSTA